MTPPKNTVPVSGLYLPIDPETRNAGVDLLYPFLYSVKQAVMNHTPTLYVTVHTESTFNRRHIFTGHIDAKLTARGVEEAKELAEQLKPVRLDLAYVSPLVRAKDTLKYILSYHPDTTIIIDRRLMERDYGSLSGKSKDKFAREHPDLYPIYHRSYDVPPPGGESIKDVERRVMPFIREIEAKIARERINVILCAHKNTIRPIRRYFEHLTPEETMRLEHRNDVIYRYPILQT